MSGGFHFLKEWTIDNNKREVSYVLTSGTEYLFRFCNNSNGNFFLEDSDRKQIMKMSIDKTTEFVWKSNSTGIRYMRFENMESNTVVLGFRR
jgi:hypothetical protein